LATDTTRNELIHQANLHLAVGDVRGARYYHEMAMTWQGTDAAGRIPEAALNVLLYSGRAAQALDLLPRQTSRQFFYPDPVTGDLLDNGDASARLHELAILGATGRGGPELEDAFDEVMALWATPAGRTRREIDVLRTANAPRLALALQLAPEVMNSWVTELDLQRKDPIWAALLPGSEDREAQLAAALDHDDPHIRGPIRSYLLGTVAQALGDHALAAMLYSRLDSLALRLDGRDVGWGLLPLSYLQRGRAYEAMGDLHLSTEFYGRFAEAWSDPDGSEHLVEEARRRIESLANQMKPRN
jgi:hypothetical protein